MGMKSNGGFFKGTRGNPVAGDANYMNSDDTFLKYIRKRKDVDPDGKFDLIAHGTSNSIEIEHNGKKVMVNSRTVAKLLKQNKDYKGQDIRLLSCNTGYLNHGFAQNLANKLNVTVWAPSDYLWVYSNGKHVVAAKTDSGQMDPTKKGKFIKFVPGGNKK